MPRNADPRFHWLLVWCVALALRVAGAFVLPNGEQDAYSYAETIGAWSAKISQGNFHFVDLFGFWLPLFQFASALVDLLVHDALLAGKLVSSGAGATACVLVFALTKRMTGSTSAALIAFVFILIAPLHLLYSAASMTDVPFGCLTLATIWFAANGRWTSAALLAACNELVRLEAWSLVLALPLLQFLLDRRISWMNMSILLVSPLLWLAICHYATGDWFGYFAKRSAYQNNFLDFHPSRHGFAFPDIGQDADYFLLGANPVVFVSIFFAATMSILSVGQRSREIIAIAICVAAILGFLGLAYLTKAQPVLLPRYGLVFFVLGLPVFPRLLQLSPRFVAIVAVLLALFPFVRQLPNIPKTLGEYRAQNLVARALRDRIGNSRCFTDDPAVRVLSRVPADRFLRSEITPRRAANDAAAFANYLREQRADYLVFIQTEDSLPVKFFPQLGRDDKIDIGGFEFISMARSPFGPDIWLYRLRNL